MCSGRHPAMTALAASVRTVSRPWRGAIAPRSAPASPDVAAAQKRPTRSGEGTTTGSPSVQPSDSS